MALAGVNLLLFASHYLNVILALGTLLPPLVALLGFLIGMLGFFERDRRKVLALTGMVLNLGFLVWWIILVVMGLGGLP
ncbi:MAG: hypothetical protein RLZZ165_957 [Bacteroidota bacterium]|jgi:hypothetical protein